MKSSEDSIDRSRGMVPHVSSLVTLYPEEQIEAQKKRFRELRARFLQSNAYAAALPVEELRYYSAPGRTELGGNHTDHQHGRVLAAAVDLDCIAVVAPRPDLLIEVDSDGYPPFVLDMSSLEPEPSEKGSSAALLRGIARWLSERHLGGAHGATAAGGSAALGGPHGLRGFSAAIHSRVLAGSGLSSSAAIEVLFGTILTDLAGLKLSPVEIARMGQYAENQFFGKPCGLMDQMASAVGGIVAIDFEDSDNPCLACIDYDFAAEGFALAVVNTGGSHADLTADYAAIPAEMRAVAGLFDKTWLRGLTKRDLVGKAAEIRARCGDRAFLRAWHFIHEDERAEAMAQALDKGDLPSYLNLVALSGDSSWRFLQNMGSAACPTEQGISLALALIEEALQGTGLVRVHGGGFAGTVQVYLPAESLEDLRAFLAPIFGEGALIPIAIRLAGTVVVQPAAFA